MRRRAGLWGVAGCWLAVLTLRAAVYADRGTWAVGKEEQDKYGCG